MDFNLYNISKKGFFFSKYEISEDNDLIYSIKRKGIFSMTYVFYDYNNVEVMSLKYIFHFFKLTFELYRDYQLLARIKKSKGIFNNNFDVETADVLYKIGGTLGMKEFTINDGHEDVARISRKKLSRSNMYGIAVSSEEDQDLILGMAFAMEAVRNIRKSKSG